MRLDFLPTGAYHGIRKPTEPTKEQPVRVRLACLILAMTACPLISAAQDSCGALEYIAEGLQDKRDRGQVLLALRATDDERLIPVFRAGLESQQVEVRSFCASTLKQLAGKDAADALAEMMLKDEELELRAEVMTHLINLDAIDEAQLRKAMAMPNEKIRCLAARELIARGKTDGTTEVLGKLVESDEIATEGMARLSLLALGDDKQLPRLKEIVKNVRVPNVIVAMLLDQAEEQEVTQGVELAKLITGSDRGLLIESRAYKTLAAFSDQPAILLGRAIRASDNLVLQTMLMEMIPGKDNDTAVLQALAEKDDTVAKLAKMELARQAGGDKASQAVLAAIREKHPIVLDYVLRRAEDDAKDKGKDAAFYIDGLAAFLDTVQRKARRPGPSHRRAAVASTVLLNIGTEKALAAVSEILDGRYDARQRAVAGGLLRTTNPKACKLAEKLLDSPYSELVTDAALTLGQFAQAKGRPALAHILKNERRYPPSVPALAAWYILTIDDQARPAAKTIAAIVRQL